MSQVFSIFDKYLGSQSLSLGKLSVYLSILEYLQWLFHFSSFP